MKKLILILLAPLIFSCGGNSSEIPYSGNVLENLKYTLHTVMINSIETFSAPKLLQIPSINTAISVLRQFMAIYVFPFFT